MARALNQGLEIAAGAAVPDLACGTSSLVTEDEISLVPCSVPGAFKATLLPSLDKRASRGRPFNGVLADVDNRRRVGRQRLSRHIMRRLIEPVFKVIGPIPAVFRRSTSIGRAIEPAHWQR